MAAQVDEDPRITGPDTAAVRTVADLARLLRQLRRREARHRGDSQLTYRELAAKTGWSRSLIGLYLSGQALPPTDRFDVLVQLLGASPAEQGVLATIRDRVEEGRHTDVAVGGDAGRPRTSGAAAGGRQASAAAGGRVERLLVPRALPAPPPHFIGREPERRMLTQLMKAHVDPGGSGADARARDERGGGQWNTVAVVVIGGTAGVGKTALAVHWAHHVADRFPDGQLYVNLRGFDAAEQVMDPAEAVRCLLDALPVPPQRIPAGLDAQVALYRSLLAGRRMLIVLDNARDPGQVRPLLPGTPGCLVLVTSRSSLSGLVAADGAHPVLLDLLSPAEGRELLTRRLGPGRVGAEPDAVDEIVDRCARLPLALAIVAARAATNPTFRLGDLAAELRDTHRRWDALANDDAATDVGSVFSWSYQALSPEAARLFRLLGLHPGPDITAPAAASLAGLTPSQVRPLLSALTQAHLLAEPTPGRYALHDLLRDYAAERARATDTDEARKAASRRMLDHYARTAYAADRLLSTLRDPIDIGRPEPGCEPDSLADAGQALDWFHAEHHVLLAAVNHAAATGYDTYTWRLAWALTTYLDRGGLWYDWIATMRPAAAAAHRIGEASPEALAHRLLARAYMRLNHLDGAHTHLRHALDLFERGGDLVGQAHTHLNLSDLWEQQGRQADAVDEARRALDLYRAAGHRPGQADALNTVGWCLAQKGEYAEAIPYCEEALVLHRDLGPGIVQATTWDSLGYAHHHLGHHTEAIACYRAAVDMFRELGARADEATTLTGLGDAHQAAGDIEAARDAWRRSLAILDDLAHPDADDVHDRLERTRPDRSA